ncbi:hypothetical protein CF54_04225 [Streptomyces sp. Tu 6176]|uniref:hypothetical protein n=1 Tax=Streptomyces sp. Tu 6176 TaxID=1470557 RepID=UPI00044A8126|nr:hypothetical protein [Streptomyces sp. Tu 6176]EYT83983.1 hypothetical protein CF54_04225 [Streptomyces sp. Tu 6176]
MQQHAFIVLDQGPQFVGWSATVEDKIVCVMTPKVHTDPGTRRIARQLVQRQGGDCAACSQIDCPLKGAAPA